MSEPVDTAALNAAIIGLVEAELDRQVEKWGVQLHPPLEWNAILGEEVGEVSKAILETWYQDRADTDGGVEYMRELVQVAAVAISAIRAFVIMNNLQPQLLKQKE